VQPANFPVAILQNQQFLDGIQHHSPFCEQRSLWLGDHQVNATLQRSDASTLRAQLSRNNSVAKAVTVREPLMGNDKLISSHTGSGSPNRDRLH
jgi:hypothetical protein